MQKPLLLSVIVPTLSKEDSQLKRFLTSLKAQDFPKDQMEVIFATKGNSEEARGHAILEAKGNILGFFCTDNLMRDKTFLRTMVWYASSMDVVGAYTSHYDYVRYDKPLSRYFALLGANDPVCWWLGKADRLSYLETSDTLKLTLPDRMPSVGDNGFFCKRALMLRSATDPRYHYVIDIVKRMWKFGYRNYYRVEGQKLWHLSGDSWLTYLKKRYRYAKELYFDKFHEREWIMVETKQDWLRVILFALSSLFVVPHLVYSLRGWLRLRDPAWFLHIPVCFFLTLIYGLLVLETGVKKYVLRSD